LSQADSIEQIYQTYKDVADFRIVYIREAHAADGRRPVEYAVQEGINEHKTYEDRCDVAEKLIAEKRLTIPCLIDSMDNAAGEAYYAWPDRVFLVRTDGRLAVAAERGPWGFKPGLDAAQAWLQEYKDSGDEPPLPADALAAAEQKEKASPQDSKQESPR
jgi:hypothetical protein